jgi:hypothetical protein
VQSRWMLMLLLLLLLLLLRLLCWLRRLLDNAIC